MGERYKDVEESSVCLCGGLPVTLVADVQHGSHENLPQIVGYSDRKTQTPVILLASGTCSSWFSLRARLSDCEIVQCRDLASAMRSALTTRNLADCAGLILKTVSIIMDPYIVLSVEN